MRSRMLHIAGLLGWFFTGWFAYQSSVYIFSFIINPLLPIQHISKIAVSKFMQNILIHMYLNLAHYIATAIFALALSYWFSAKKQSVIAYIAGIYIFPLYYLLTSNIEYSQQYQQLPSWVVSHNISQAVYFILLLLAVWGGCVVGNKLRPTISS